MCDEDNQEYSGPNVDCICTSCGYAFSYPIPCGDRNCPNCNQRRKREIIERLGPVVDTFQESRFLTLTMKSVKLTRAAVSSIRKAFTKLRHRPIWSPQFCFKGFYNIEVGNLREDGTCNIHSHIIYDGVAMDQAYLSWVWNQVTGDSYVVDIRECYNARNAMHYIAKHFCKIGDFEGEKSQELINIALKNTRLVQGFGRLRALPKPGPSECPQCHALCPFISSHNPLYEAVLSAFDGSEYDRQPA